MRQPRRLAAGIGRRTASIYTNKSYEYIINIIARTARVLSALTAVLEKVKIISKQVFPKNNYYQNKIFVF